MLDPKSHQENAGPGSRRSSLPSRTERKKVPIKQRVAQLEELAETLIGAVLVLREAYESVAGRPLLRDGDLSLIKRPKSEL